MGKRLCTSCEQRLRDEHLCPSCGHPTDLATAEERTRWEVSVWRRSRGVADEKPVRRPGTTAPPGGPRAPTIRDRVAKVDRDPEPLEDVIDLSDRDRPTARPPARPPAAPTPPVAPPAEVAEPPPSPPRVDLQVSVSDDGVTVEVREDHRERSFVRDALSQHDVFVDVGAGLGRMSLLAARRVGETGRVVAVEPNVSAVNYLHDAITRERRSNVSVIQAAVGTDAAAGMRPLETIVRRLNMSRVDLLRIAVGDSLPEVLEGIKGFLSSPVLTGPVLVTIDRAALDRSGRGLDLLGEAFPPDAWADTTGLRLGGSDQHLPRFSMVFERR